MVHNGFSIDIEADGFVFEASNIWTICLEDLDTDEKQTINPFKDKQAYAKLQAWVNKYDKPNIAFHNGLGYDIFVLYFVLGVDFTVGPDTMFGKDVNFVDTFYLSMYLNPDRQGNSLADFGERIGLHKIDFREELIRVGDLDVDAPEGAEFSKHHALMDTYCERDTLVGKKTYLSLVNEWISIYKSWDVSDRPQHFKSGQKSFYLMSCQELSGWKFDLEKAKLLAIRIEQMMEEIRADVEPKLPPRALKKTEQQFYTMPAKPFKKDGSLASSWVKFVEKHNAIAKDDSWVFYDKQYKPEAGQLLDVKLPMQMANQDQLKDWLLESGWKPTLFNFKRDANGKPERDDRGKLIQTTPKLQEAGKLCPNLEAMEGDLIRQIVKWLSLRNRQSVLTSWVNHPRLQYDGRIGAGRTGIAACFTADTSILTENGLRNWFQVEVGDLVVTHRDRLQPITDKFENGIKEVFEVTLENGIVTKLTANHPLYTDDGTFIKVEDLEIGQKVMAYPEKEIWGQWNKSEVLVSSWGRVRNLKTGYEYPPRRGVKDRSISVDMRFNGKRGSFRVGRLVLDTHKGLGSGLHCLHMNDMPYDNNVHNLYCGSDKENGKDRSTFTSAVKSARTRESTVLDWESVTEIRKSKLGNKALAEIYGVSPSNISQIRSFKRWNKSEEDYDQKVLSLVPVKIKSIVSIGNHMTYGVSVKEDESHLTDGIMSHNTHRQKHKVVVNVPKADPKVLLGYEFRDLWASEDGFMIAAGDAAALEGRVQGHYCFRYDGGSTAEELLIGDVHSKNCVAFYGEVHPWIPEFFNSKEFDKEDPKWKPFRSKSKNGYYALMYGAGAPKVASTLGLPEKHGKSASEAFWQANPGTASLKASLEKYWESVGQSKYLPAIDGRILLTRKKSALLNTIFQSCGGIAMDYAGCFLDRWLGGLHFDEKRRPYYLYRGCVVRRIGYFHDELEFECEAAVADQVSKLIEKAIEKAGEHLKLKVPLAGEGKVGKTWKEVH